MLFPNPGEDGCSSMIGMERKEMKAFLAAMKELEEAAPEWVINSLHAFEQLLKENVWIQLPPIPIKIDYEVNVELPEELVMLIGGGFEDVEDFPRQARFIRVGIEVNDEKGSVLFVVIKETGDDDYGFSYVLESNNLGELAAIFLLWCLLKRQGVDFLADLRRKIEERREKILGLLSKLEELEVLLKGVTL